jgi:hypothetical protein
VAVGNLDAPRVAALLSTVDGARIGFTLGEPKRRRVAGVTKNADQRARGSSRDRAASTTHSSARSSGRCTWRRRTATLMPQDQQLDVLRAAVPGQLGQHLQDLAEQ